MQMREAFRLVLQSCATKMTELSIDYAECYELCKLSIDDSSERSFWSGTVHIFYLLRIARRERNMTCLCESVRTLLLFSLFTKILIRSSLSRIVRVSDRFWSHRRHFCTPFTRCPMLIVRLRERDAFASKMRPFSILFPVLWTWTKSTVCQHRKVLHRVAFAQSLSFTSLRQPKQLNSSVGFERHRSYAIREENGWYWGEYHLLHACP